MAAIKDFVMTLGNENLAPFIMAIGALMLSWIFFLGDMILPMIQ